MTYDLVVADSSPSALIAAIAAAQRGLSVVVVTEDAHLGGMHTSGLGWTNAGQRATLGGLARQWFDRVREYYVNKYGDHSPQVEACSDGLHFEPHVAEKIYTNWLNEVGVTCVTRDAVVGVEKQGAQITAIVTQSGRRIEGKVFIDASYEGDLLHLAGCRWHAGRESRQTYGESLAGVRFPAERAGEGDHKLQAYDYRLCLTDDAANRVPFAEPQNYDPRTYDWHAAKIAHHPPQRLHDLLPLNPMPNRKTDSRTGEWIGASWDWPCASLAQRQQIAHAHQQYSAGYIWFLLTDPRVPADFQQELHQWGHAADEFVDNNHWPYHLYVREARRMIGDYVMTQRDVTTERTKDDAIALGSFFLDVHAVDMTPDPDAPAGMRPEGGLGSGYATRPYAIAYRSLLPEREQCSNLLATVCMSASHVAYSTIRMETVFMMLGHAAGAAAAMALKQGKSVHDVVGRELREQLAAEGQMVDASTFAEVWPPRRELAPGLAGE